MGSSNTGGGKPDSSGEGGDARSDPSDSGSARPEPSYSEEETVLAFHGPLLYKAKVQKVEYRKKEWRHFVHYTGWSKNWDEWVGTERLLKFTDENIERQKALQKQAGDKNVKSRSSHNKPKGSNDAKTDKEETKIFGSKGKKRKAYSGVEEKDTRSTEKAVSIPLPSTLKKQLVDNWEFTTQLGKLVKLPRTPNVDDILKKYLDYRTKKDGLISDSLGEILKGIRCYFDKALPEMLLYKKECQQYEEAIVGNISPSSVYGAEHLLRLFVKLPELLAYVNMEEEALSKLQQNLLDFLKYLQKNQSAFFLSSYDGMI
ncbi:Mortality factor 4 like 1 [Zostera marina]|uniref:Mortality factor 4 like 1 n=1 Tax=Zostera marina TaxID=29655 RepID=A0A0K9PQT8_ZOSMR|nr:Mortality factor 4 like 1 [Zostera marina]